MPTSTGGVFRKDRLRSLYGEGPEYNTQMCMGAPWVFEIYEKGIINENDTGGLKLEWANAGELLSDLLEMVAHRKGFADLLAEGPYKALERLNKPVAEYYLLHIKGLGYMISDERATPALK